MLAKYTPIVFILYLWSCGAPTDGSTTVTPTDTISSSATIQFNTANATITVKSKDASPQSTVFDECGFSMDTVKDSLSYDLVDQDHLEVGTGEYTYKRALKTAKTKAGVPDRVFSVWGSPDIINNGVTLAFELEVEPELLTFRMVCTG